MSDGGTRCHSVPALTTVSTKVLGPQSAGVNADDMLWQISTRRLRSTARQRVLRERCSICVTTCNNRCSRTQRLYVGFSAIRPSLH